MLEIEIDGKKAQVADGSTVMDAATQLGVYIPHFCYHKKLSIAANCRMCLVQVEKAPKPLPACATPVTNGMKVFTHSDLALKAQKGVMEFLLINHPLDCPICDQGGECQLQDLAVGYGDVKSRYTEDKHVVFHKNVGPLISMQEMSRCIHCTRCVRFGQEVAGVMELGMANRNMHSEIMTFLGRSVDSELSGNSIDLCPVGALTSKPFRYSARSWELIRRKTISPHDSHGSNVVAHIKNNKVLRMIPFENEEVNECWISDKDRFAYEGLNSADRLLKPQVKQDGKWVEADWNVALDYVSHALRDVAKNHGADQIAALVAPHSTLEEMSLVRKIMREIGCSNYDFRTRQKDFTLDSHSNFVPWLGMKIKDVSCLDTALVVGSNVRKDHPLLALRLRQAVKRGATLHEVNCLADDQLLNSSVRHIVAPSDIEIRLASILKAVLQSKGQTVPSSLADVVVDPDCVVTAGDLLADGNKAIFLGNLIQQHTRSAAIVSIARALAFETGAKLGFFGQSGNSVGGYVAGLIPSGLNGYTMFEQPRKAYMLMNVDPEVDLYNPALATSALKQASTVIYLSPFDSDFAREHADVMLPVAPYTETSGTFINCEGRVQSFEGVVAPAGEARPGWKVLRVLANLLKVSGVEYSSSAEVRDEMLSSGKDFVTLPEPLTLPSRDVTLSDKQNPTAFERISHVGIHFTDGIVRRATSLQQTKDASLVDARMHSSSLASLGLGEGAKVRLHQDGTQAVMMVHADDRVPVGCIHTPSGQIALSTLGDMFGYVSVERA